MKITDIISITELSRLLKKSRPTVYKYISDFEKGNYANVPHSVRKLFNQIQSDSIPKREIYEYCDHWFADEPAPAAFASVKEKKEKTATLKEIVKLLKDHEKTLDLPKIKNYIEQEIKR